MGMGWAIYILLTQRASLGTLCKATIAYSDQYGVDNACYRILMKMTTFYVESLDMSKNMMAVSQMSRKVGQECHKEVQWLASVHPVLFYYKYPPVCCYCCSKFAITVVFEVSF